MAKFDDEEDDSGVDRPLASEIETGGEPHDDDEEGDEEGEEEEDEELSPRDMCEMLVDAAATCLPAKKIAEPLLGRAFSMVSAWTTLAHHQQGEDGEIHRGATAGLMILVLGIEGLAEFLRSSPSVFERLMRSLLALATSAASVSPHPIRDNDGEKHNNKRSTGKSRNSSEVLERFACLALGELVGNLPEEMLQVSEEVIPALANKYRIVGMRGELVRLSHALSRVLDEFCEVLDQDQLAPLYG